MFRIYLFLLAASASLIAAFGAIVAPVIFRASLYLGDGALELEQSGILMAQIFVKSNYFLLFCAVFAMVYELFLRHFGTFLRISRLFLALINLLCIASFTLYFSPQIISMQAANLANSADFWALHQASEIVYKIAALANCALFFTFRQKNPL